jgi:hypothetical protein
VEYALQASANLVQEGGMCRVGHMHGHLALVTGEAATPTVPHNNCVPQHRD